jgi:hypothetical protein
MAEVHGAASPVPISDIAERTGLNVTSIHRIAWRLGQLHYATRRRNALRFVYPTAVFQAWLNVWDGWSQVALSFHVGLKWRELVPALNDIWRDLDWAWTGTAGAALVTDVGVPLQRVCYVAADHERVARQRLVSALPAVPVSEGERGTMHVAVPLCERTQLRFGRHVTTSGAPVVSTLQLALDLEQGPGGVERPSVVEVARCVLRARLLGVPCDRQRSSA